MTTNMLTQAALKAELHYDAETGVFTRAASRPRQPAGSAAGTVDESGRIRICVLGKIYRAHRLAWLYVHGTWPDDDVDHIDGNPANNRITNLRHASRAQNMQNQRKARSDNKCGLLGVQARAPGKYRAAIAKGGRRLNLGTFSTPEGAHEAYVAAKRAIHEFCAI